MGCQTQVTCPPLSASKVNAASLYTPSCPTLLKIRLVGVMLALLDPVACAPVSLQLAGDAQGEQL